MIREPEFDDFAAGADAATGVSSATLDLLFDVQTFTAIRNAHEMPWVGNFCRVGTNCAVEKL